jgi:hypothetical protein
LRDRCQIQRQQRTLLRELVHANDGPYGSMSSHTIGVHAIHFFKITHVQQENVDVKNMLKVGILRLLQQGKSLKNLARLRPNSLSRKFTGLRINSSETSKNDKRPGSRNMAIGADWSRRSAQGIDYDILSWVSCFVRGPGLKSHSGGPAGPGRYRRTRSTRLRLEMQLSQSTGARNPIDQACRLARYCPGPEQLPALADGIARRYS